ncbi:hypothetical protein HK100_003087, partial [Physocladia obscura]
MASFVIPLALMSTEAPAVGQVARAISTNDGSAVIVAFESGTIAIYAARANSNVRLFEFTFSFSLVSSQTRHSFSLTPRLLLFGRGSQRISALVLATLDIDGPATKENVLLAADETGGVIMWDLADGRALQAAEAVYPATISHLLISSSSRFVICAGLSECFAILDAASLECLKVIKNISGWTASMNILNFGPNSADTIFRGTTSGNVDAFKFNETSIELVRTQLNSISFDGPRHDYSPITCIHISKFGLRLIMAIQKRVCHILQPEQNFTSISGSAYIYFIGNADQLHYGSSSNSSCILVSNGETIISGNDPQFSATENSTPFSAIASFKLSSALKLSNPINSTGRNKSKYKITAATLVSDKLIAIGYDFGQILVVPIAAPFFHTSDELKIQAVCVFDGHDGPVRTLFQMDFRGPGVIVGGKNILVSSGVDDMIKIWDLESGKLLGRLVCHACPVRIFVPIPLNAGMKLKHGIISVAEDESVAIIDLDSMQSRYILTGHAYPILALHWRSLEETMIVQCSNSERTIYLKTGHLDRFEQGEIADDILSCCDCYLMLNDFGNDYANASTRQTFSAFPITHGLRATPSCFILLINLKRFINDVYGGQYSLTPPTTPPQSVRNRHRHIHERRTEQSPTRNSNLKIPGLSKSPSHSRISTVSPSPASPTPVSRSLTMKKGNELNASSNSRTIMTPPITIATATMTTPIPRVFGDKNLVRAILSIIMSWGVDNEIDRTCQNSFELTAPLPAVSIGHRGANGFISIPIHHQQRFEKSDVFDLNSEWTLSPTMSASRMLQIVSLLRTLGIKKEYHADVSQIIAKFCVISRLELQNSESCFQHPSFSFLAKYWQDQILDVQQAARIVFSKTLNNLSGHEKLPSLSASISKKPAKVNMRASVILGIIGCEDPSLFSQRVCKDVAESLDILLREDIRSSHRLMAVELIGRGFKTWEPHVNASSILRSIITTTGLQSPAPQQIQQQQLNSVGSVGPSSALVMVSRQAVVQIASVNPGLFISTVTFDFVHSKIIAERVGGLKLLGMFVAKKPMLLYSHIPRIIESMVKSLDPNVAGMREAVQNVVTSNFAELVKTFPNVAFHHGSQKLAVGTAEGPTVVYDLKTATKAQVLEGHARPVTAVAFSPDGKLSATFSYEENVVRFWQLSVGFLNSLVGAFGGGGGGGSGNSPSGLAKAGYMKSFREFSVGPPQ